MGVFSRAKEPGGIAFVKGEKVLPIEGCLALRVNLDNDRYLEWLYDNGLIHGLEESPDVIWSSVGLSTDVNGKIHRVEVGTRPEQGNLIWPEAINPSVLSGILSPHAQGA
ncbi:hypothetical protein, partial [Parendozoicomonas sp. Alg238-R29]|uniref:hypothetical protein n=1 Tax=Parendozoicomonas sp. Alg238-R29 TaxID=2993446 RepID=UPI00248EAB93